MCLLFFARSLQECFSAFPLILLTPLYRLAEAPCIDRKSSWPRLCETSPAASGDTFTPKAQTGVHLTCTYRIWTLECSGCSNSQPVGGGPESTDTAASTSTERGYGGDKSRQEGEVAPAARKQELAGQYRSNICSFVLGETVYSIFRQPFKL